MLCTNLSLVRSGLGLLGLLGLWGLPWGAFGCAPTPRSGSQALSGSALKLTVGEQSIGVDLVKAAAQSSGHGHSQAAALLIRDARLAEWLARGWPARAEQIKRLALARATLDAMRAESQMEPVRGPEYQALVRDEWWLWDRPRLVRTAHAVVLTEKSSASAYELAASLRDRVGQRGTASELLSACRAIARPREKVRCERLSPVAADGRAVDPEELPPKGPPPQLYDPAFAAAASRLVPGRHLSPVTQTPFGYHVIAAIDAYPAQRLGPQDPGLRRAVARLRVERALEALLQARAVSVSRTPRALALTAELVP